MKKTLFINNVDPHIYRLTAAYIHSKTNFCSLIIAFF